MLLDATKNVVHFSKLIDNRKYYFVIVDRDQADETRQELLGLLESLASDKSCLPFVFACDTAAERDEAIEQFLHVAELNELPEGIRFISMLEDKPDVFGLIGARCIIWDSRSHRTRRMASEFHHFLAMTDQLEEQGKPIPRPLLLMTQWPEATEEPKPEEQQPEE